MAGKFIPQNTPEENRFTSISDFKWSMICGGEATFEWNGVMYGVYRDGTYQSGEKYCICLASGENLRRFDTLDALLEVSIGEDCLRDIITQVTVWSRNT